MSRFSFLILILFSCCAFVVLLSGTFSSQLCWGPIDWEEGGREWTRVGTIFMASRCPASVQITRSCESVLPVEGRGSGLVEGDCGGELPPPHPHCPPLASALSSSRRVVTICCIIVSFPLLLQQIAQMPWLMTTWSSYMTFCRVEVWWGSHPHRGVGQQPSPLEHSRRFQKRLFSCLSQPPKGCLNFLNGNPLQYSCLENPMDRGAWWVTDHGVAKGQTQLSD